MSTEFCGLRIPAGGQLALAVDAQGERFGRRLPEEAGGRHHQRVGHVVGVAARRSGEGAFHVVADKALHQPLVAVEADGAAGVEVVEQHVAFGQRVVVGRDVAAVHGELGVAVTLADIAEDLIVGPVLLDDEEDMLDAQGGQVGDASGGFEHRAVGGAHFARAGGDLRRQRRRNALQRALVNQGTEGAVLALGVADALDVQHAQRAIGLDRDGGGEPRGGNGARLPSIACRRARTTAMALLPPQATYRRLPSGGEARLRSAGCPAPHPGRWASLTSVRSRSRCAAGRRNRNGRWRRLPGRPPGSTAICEGARPTGTSRTLPVFTSNTVTLPDFEEPVTGSVNTSEPDEGAEGSLLLGAASGAIGDVDADRRPPATPKGAMPVGISSRMVRVSVSMTASELLRLKAT